MLKKKQIYKFLDLFTINEDKCNDLIENITPIGVAVYLGNLALKQGLINYDEELNIIKQDTNKLKQLIEAITF